MNENVPPILTASTAVPSSSSSRTWEVLCHLSSIIGMVGYFAFIPGNILAPLIIWALKRHDSPGIDAHGKESLNFHISWTIYWLAASAVVGALCIILIGILLVPFLILAAIVGWFLMVGLTVIASVKASHGVLYRYPLTIRFLK